MSIRTGGIIQRLTWFAIAVTVTLQAQENPRASVPVGTIVELRLLQPLSSFATKERAPFSATVIAPVELAGQIVVPQHAVVRGTVLKVRRVGLGFSREVATLDLAFDSIQIGPAAPIPISARVQGIDDARETVDSRGRIRGIRATASLSNAIAGLAVSASSLNPMVLSFALSSSISAFRVPESEITFPVGTELHIVLTAPLFLSDGFPSLNDFLNDATERAALTETIQPLPFRTATDPGDAPSDLTTVTYIGERDAIERAFLAAGWLQSDDLSARSRYGAVRSILGNHGYREAPMSTLTLAGALPEFTFSKSLNTFFSRHHLRLYGTSARFQGKPVWVSTGTHDSAIAFSQAAKTLIHLIDENIDQERTKIVNDLAFTGCVEGLSYVERPWVPRDARNATGNSLLTDGRTAAILFTNCDSPTRFDQGEQLELRTHGGMANRIVRNTILTLRNDLYRDNAIYQAYSLIRWVLPRRTVADPGAITPHLRGGERWRFVRGAPSLKDPRTAGSSGPFDRGSEQARSYASFLDLSISAGFLRFPSQSGSTQMLDITEAAAAGLPTGPATLTNEYRNGWSWTTQFTLNSHKRISHEFGYSHQSSSMPVDGAGGDPASAVRAATYRAAIRQTSYNTQFHLRANGARIRPYFAAGPVLQLLRLDESQPKENGVLKYAVRNIGILYSSYDFGKRPPLEGGGIFQLGIQYGMGVTAKLNSRWFVRADYRETISSQPDLWSKSHSSLAGVHLEEDASYTVGPLMPHGRLRQQRFTLGIGVSF